MMDYRQFGGRPTDADTHEHLDFDFAMAQPDHRVTWNFGLVTPPMLDRADPSLKAANDAFKAAQTPFAIRGTSRQLQDGESVRLFDLWSDPRVVSALGFAFPGSHQFTGSCVGSGYGNVVMCLSMVEAMLKSEPERVTMLFWYYTYGRGRWIMGDHGQGEGSTGTAQAEAAKQDGVLRADFQGLPSYTHDDGVCYGSNVEMKWSDGSYAGRSLPDVPPEAKHHLVKTTAVIRNADEGEQALVNGYPMGWCGSWGGLMQCEVKGNGNNRCLMNRRSGSWSHQQSCHAVWHHPELGRIFWIQNQWGLNAHGRDPAGGPPGGYWISEKDFNWQCQDSGEVIAYSQHEGYPAQQLDFFWSNG